VVDVVMGGRRSSILISSAKFRSDDEALTAFGYTTCNTMKDGVFCLLIAVVIELVPILGTSYSFLLTVSVFSSVV
jgi:hypothetical protein